MQFFFLYFVAVASCNLSRGMQFFFIFCLPKKIILVFPSVAGTF